MRKIVALISLFFIAIAGISLVFAQPPKLDEQKYPDILSVRVQPRGEDHFDFDVTVSSPYDTPQRYADAFRVMNAEGVIYGERKLWHDHESEQPFARDLYGVIINKAVQAVLVQGRDQKYGYGGKVVTVKLPGR